MDACGDHRFQKTDRDGGMEKTGIRQENLGKKQLGD
jgi:hypothetical protein